MAGDHTVAGQQLARLPGDLLCRREGLTHHAKAVDQSPAPFFQRLPTGPVRLDRA
jgi:hypothetical protein